MTSFESGEDPTPVVQSRFAYQPSILSPTPGDVDLRSAEFGARILQLPLFEQGRQIARVLEARAAAGGGAPLYPTVGVELPRRATKTTAINAVLLGRCFNIPNYRIASTAQDGLRARFKLREVMDAVDRVRANLEYVGGSEQVTRRFPKTFRGVPERMEFPNGSVWKAVQPDPGAFRSDAFDCVLVDEAGELEPEKADALQAGFLPTMDTRTRSQVIVAGTPGTSRAGLLWDTLEALEAGTPGYGGVVYRALDTDAFADMSDPDNPRYDLDLLRRVHPGIACGLTTVEKVMSRLGKMGLPKWSAEYLCQWPRNAATSALDVAAWAECASPTGLPPRPDRVAVAWDVDPDGQRAAVVAAWRDEQGCAHFEVLACRPNPGEWLALVVRKAVMKHNRAAVFDPIGQNVDQADVMTRSRTRIRPLKMRDMIGAASRLELAIHRRGVVHYDQADLTEAVEGAAWRPVGVDGRLFARKASAASVCTVVAASEALWDFDSTQVAASTRRVRTAAAIAAARAAS